MSQQQHRLTDKDKLKIQEIIAPIRVPLLRADQKHFKIKQAQQIYIAYIAYELRENKITWTKTNLFLHKKFGYLPGSFPPLIRNIGGFTDIKNKFLNLFNYD